MVEEGVGRAVVVEVEDLGLAGQAGEGAQLDRGAVGVAGDVGAEQRRVRPGGGARPVHQQRVDLQRHPRAARADPVFVEPQRDAAQAAELEGVDPARQGAVVVHPRRAEVHPRAGAGRVLLDLSRRQRVRPGGRVVPELGRPVEAAAGPARPADRAAPRCAKKLPPAQDDRRDLAPTRPCRSAAASAPCWRRYWRNSLRRTPARRSAGRPARPSGRR